MSTAVKAPPSDNNEPTCVECGRIASDGIYDERAEVYFCGRACFDDWADGNFEVVIAYYVRKNLHGY